MKHQKDNYKEWKIKRDNWRKEKPEIYKSHRRKHYENNKEKEAKRLKEWQQNNPDKLKEYRIKRELNKTHEISTSEWEECKKYFENSCGYCEMSEEEHMSIFKQVLHRDHVDHNGVNDLSNCVPACKSCNSSKHNFELDDWYNENNTDFTADRLDRIHKWLLSDWKNFIEITDS